MRKTWGRDPHVNRHVLMDLDHQNGNLDRIRIPIGIKTMTMNSVFYLADIVEIPVRDGLLGGQLSQLVEKDVQLELVRQVGQTSVAEALQRPCTQEGADRP
jgi:hypothetical protein